MDLPLWIASTVAGPGIISMRIERALADGLKLRPLEQTLRDTRAWSRTIGVPVPSTSCAGITRKHERELLDAWHAIASYRIRWQSALPIFLRDAPGQQALRP